MMASNLRCRHLKLALKSCFSWMFLDCIYNDGMDMLLHGVQEQWTLQKLAACVKGNLENTAQCQQVQWFLEVVVELESLLKKRFVQIVKGGPVSNLAPRHVSPLSLQEYAPWTPPQEGTS